MVIEHEDYRVLMLHRPATCALLQHSTAFCWGFDSLFIYCRPRVSHNSFPQLQLQGQMYSFMSEERCSREAQEKGERQGLLHSTL